MSPLELTPAEVADVLGRGELEVLGRMRYASNGAALVTARLDGVEIMAVYKPRRSERPLWDFPDGTLCNREVAAYEVSEALGWGIVPVTVMRDAGPFGPGAVQRFVDHDSDEHYFTLLAQHADRFRAFAVFDVLVNNTDRKAGHCLHDLTNDAVIGIDHGLTFHPVTKVRTVIWDFAGEAVQPDLADDVCRLLAEVGDGRLGSRLRTLLDPYEIAAMQRRGSDLLEEACLPYPEHGYRSVPWPLV